MNLPPTSPLGPFEDPLAGGLTGLVLELVPDGRNKGAIQEVSGLPV
ncbi:MAG: hypothetical protein HC886_12640 [Leptolyngbyaceae cyanobacterium SM1_1_3]|nr:hypothetical protein [Leptolyngbyaceae cyanobacterium SM1_1_3]NJN02371.1 hypothetical protein [Leptolyngbyaceae cyanobacterium RM1_1_2]NJO10405.1 hypothetical protein [Leptolyngbyaceae cyanobacterium SL_1_1]